MLDTMGKILESIINSRLEEYTEGPMGLSPNQFGFRKQRSTIDAIAEVCKIAKNAISGRIWLGGTKNYCAVVTLDVRNAFNSAEWSAIINALINKNVPNYLIKMVTSYFDNRVLWYDTCDGPRRYKVTCGVPQGSVLGPTLWNVMYDGILRITKPKQVEIIGFADDIAVVVVGKTLQEMAALTERTIGIIKRWLTSSGLELADQKTEMVLISSRKKIEKLEISVGGHRIVSSDSIKYLGVMLDRRLCFRNHIEYASAKASTTCMAISRLLPNTNGPCQPARKLLASVCSATLLYASQVWATSTLKTSYIKEARRVNRLCNLRIICGYRTISDEAAEVLAGRAPIDIQGKRLRKIYLHKKHPNEGETLEDIERQVISEWQTKWETSNKGRWTFSLIPNIQTWINRKHGNVNFALTQFLSGHGCFREYLHRFKRADSPYCLHCENKVESPDHVLAECSRFWIERISWHEQINSVLTVKNLVQYMLKSEESWNTGCEIVATITRRLRKDDNVLNNQNHPT